MDEINKYIQNEVPRCMIFSDDIVLVSESLEKINGRPEEWRKALEGKGLRIILGMTKYYKVYDFGEREHKKNKLVKIIMKLNGDLVGKVERFEHLRSVLLKNGHFEEDKKHRIKSQWINWREASGILCTGESQLG